MDLEAPVDGWYVWLGVALLSVAVLAFAISLPAQPPPDATAAANAIDRVASSSHQAAASYDHDAGAIKIDTKRIVMRNDGGTSRESVAFGSLTPVHAVADEDKREALEQITYGHHPASVLDNYSFGPRAVLEAAAAARERIDRHGAEWRPADGVLYVRRVDIGSRTLVLVDENR
jgi:hypothetical protein